MGTSFFEYTIPAYFSDGEVENTILYAPLIPWKYRGFYVGKRDGTICMESGIPRTQKLLVWHRMNGLGFERKIFEGLRRSTRRPFPPWRVGRSVSERSGLWGTLRRNNLDMYA